MNLDAYLQKRKKKDDGQLYPPIIDYAAIYIVFIGLPMFSGYNYAIGNSVRATIAIILVIFLLNVILFGKKILNAFMQRI